MTAEAASAGGGDDLARQLRVAEEEEAKLRRTLAELVTRSRTSAAEAERLRSRAQLADADARVAEAAERYAAAADRAAADIEATRRALRIAEGEVVSLRAQLETGG